MKYELIFAAVALALLLGVVALFAWRLLMGRTDERREWARVELGDGALLLIPIHYGGRARGILAVKTVSPETRTPE